MRQIQSTLRAGLTPHEITDVLNPPRVSVMTEAVPINVGPRSKILAANATPKGHFAIMTDGGLTLIVDGAIRDSPHAVNADVVKDELSGGAPVVVYGLGAGQLVTAIRTLSEEARGGQAAPILVYEPDPGILARFLTLGLPMQGVSVACDIEDFRAMFQYLLQGRGTVSTFHNSFAVEANGQEAFERWVDVVRRIVDAEQVTMNTILVRMPEWVRNVSANLEVIEGTKPLMSLVGEFTNVPAFIVGAGPSLDLNGHLLAECASKGMVFVVDVAARAVARYGAEPHIFVAVEGADLSEHLAGIDWIDRVPRAFSLEASPAVLRTGNGPLLPWCDSNHSFAEVNTNLLGVEGLPIGGSVTTAAFLMAESFGCNPIVMVGQDLANTDGKRASADTLADKLAVLDEHGSVMRWGSTDYTDTIPDTPQWLHARVWFEQRASVVKDYNPDAQLINCTEGGSHIEGFADMPLANLLAQLQPMTVDVIGKLGSVQPIWRQGIDWFRTRQLDTLEPIAPLALETAKQCRRVAYLVRGDWPNEDVQQAMEDRAHAENAFRAVANQCLFIGSVQVYLRALNELREASTRKQVTGADAAKFFDDEAAIFAALAAMAAELLKAMKAP